MLPLDHPDRIQITFDDRRLVANAGLLLPVTLAQHLGLRELVDHHLDLGNAPGRANAAAGANARSRKRNTASDTSTACSPTGPPPATRAPSRTPCANSTDDSTTTRTHPVNSAASPPHDAERNADEFRQIATAIRDQHRQLTQPDAEKRADFYCEMNQRCRSLMTQAELATRFELDHRDALSVAWASGDERRLMRALALGNLRWLCHACHAAKTGDDRRMMASLLNGTYQHSKHPLDPSPITNTQPSQPNPEQASLWND